MQQGEALPEQESHDEQDACEYQHWALRARLPLLAALRGGRLAELCGHGHREHRQSRLGRGGCRDADGNVRAHRADYRADCGQEGAGHKPALSDRGQRPCAVDLPGSGGQPDALCAGSIVKQPVVAGRLG